MRGDKADQERAIRIAHVGERHRRQGGAIDFRRVVLNAILWTAKMEIPSDGVQTKITEADLQENLDPKPVKKK